MEPATSHSFLGEFEHSVDDKGRVVIPQDFRGPLGDEFIATRGTDRCIWVFPVGMWQPMLERVGGMELQRDRAFLQRMLFGRSVVRLDPQARLAIPKHLRDHAGVSQTNTVAIVGVGSKIEIWNKPTWDAFTERFSSENVYPAAEAIGLAESISR